MSTSHLAEEVALVRSAGGDQRERTLGAGHPCQVLIGFAAFQVEAGAARSLMAGNTLGVENGLDVFAEADA